MGRLLETRGAGGWSTGDRVLVRSSDSADEELEAVSSACVRLPNDLDSADALLVPQTAQALRMWRRLGLELGEAAVYTDGHELSDLIGLVALWHGGLPVIRLTTGVVAEASDIETVTVDEASAAVERLRSLTASAPGLAAVDLSGNGAMIAALLEALPRWGRLLFQTLVRKNHADIPRRPPDWAGGRSRRSDRCVGLRAL